MKTVEQSSLPSSIPFSNSVKRLAGFMWGQPVNEKRRRLLKTMTGVTIGTAIAPFLPHESAVLAQTTPEAPMYEANLLLISEAWEQYALDEYLTEAISKAEYFGFNTQKYEEREFGNGYQGSLQVLDFFVDIQKLIQAYNEDPQRAYDLIDEHEWLPNALDEIITPMFSVLADHADCPDAEKRNALIDQDYAQKRLELTELSVEERAQMSDFSHTGNTSTSKNWPRYLFTRF